MTANRGMGGQGSGPSGMFFLKFISWSALIASAVLVVVWVVGSRGEWMSKRLMSVAERKWQQDDYLGAIRDYENLIEAYPKSTLIPEAYYWKGLTFLLYLDDAEVAVAAFKKVIQLEKVRGVSEHSLSARHRLAEVYERQLKRPTEAISTYESIVATSDDREQVLASRFRIGELYYEMGDMAQARVEWDLIVENAPKSPWAPSALYRKAGSYFVSGACEAAVPVYKTLYTTYPKNENSRFAKFRAANCFEMDEQPTEALNLYKELEENYPDPAMIKQKVDALNALIHQDS
ncbi:hypothetical protein MNBD_NITROSPIRAE01-357 [hydrothermal vent metagenome]|uniref:Uncharacterized protein n=1 Tax=hydrothermal vent metagenome TaxID=652676 RepID=A0A3B1CV08_9ZZZZ